MWSKSDNLFCSKRLPVKRAIEYTFLFIVILLISSAAVFIFTDELGFGFFLAVFTAIIAVIVIIAYVKKRRTISLDKQLLWLLEYISTALITGSTFEKSLIKAADELSEQQSNKYRELRQALAMLSGCLHVHLDLDRAIATFLYYFNCQNASQILGSITELRQSGGKIERYIQDSTSMLREQLELTRSIEAEQSGKQTETYIMTTTPFFMALILKYAGSFQQQLFSTQWGAYAMLAVYMISCTSLLLAIIVSSASFSQYRLINNSNIIRLLLSGSINSSRPLKTSISRRFRNAIAYDNKRAAKIYQTLIPDRIWLPAITQLRCETAAMDINENCMLRGFFKTKFVLIIIFSITVLMLMFINLKTSLLFILLPFIIFSQEICLLRRSAQRRRQENMVFPKWLNLLSILLSSGLTLQKSLSICSQYKLTGKKRNNKGIDYFQLEMRQMQTQLDNGIAPVVILSGLSSRCSIFQVRNVLDLIIRYARDGSGELLGIISLGASDSWHLYRDELRKGLTSKNLFYLIPSALSLLAVIATALIPAAATFII